jgi:hypothetical protein
MNIEELVNRFRHYATTHKDLRHDPSNRLSIAFIHLDIEELQIQLKDGMKFPALLLQTPDTSKSGNYDSRSENMNFTYLVINHDDRKDKATLISEAKTIADAIFNRLSVDAAQEEEIYGVIEGTDEGMFGPHQGMWGWAVSVSLESPVDAEVKAQDWLDLSTEAP